MNHHKSRGLEESTAHRSTSNWQSRMVSWLMSDGLKVQEVPQGPATWCVLVENAVGHKVTVTQALDRADSVIVAGGCTFDPQSLDQLPESEREAFLWDLRLFLVQLGLDFVGVQRPLQQVTVSLPVYCEGLTHREFAGAVRRTFLGVFAVLGVVARRLGTPGPLREIDTTRVN